MLRVQQKGAFRLDPAVKALYLHRHGKTENHGPWRMSLAEKLESYKFEMLVVLLLLIDCVCVFVEILSFEGAMNMDKAWVRTMVSSMMITSKTVVGLFVVDTILHIVAFGPKHYFGNKWYVLDGFVVTVTAILEFVVHPLVHHETGGGGHRLLGGAAPSHGEEGSRAEETTVAVAVALVLIRSWRFLRLLHGVAFSEKLRQDEFLKMQGEEELLETELTDAVKHDKMLAEENARLRERVKELEAIVGGGGGGEAA
ncbi:hypothetical protein TeGR_g10743 [Tetraparma gracilis]|uniref:Voltage-gated hydrogen channel 1 n=1 Tax=Tetraparma gracilis TaxID=2962635 RepID=A0ABQ6M4Z6_9STRA|nr:hypothetical protein TeGR_g10743 [Tetraparma gracilis]